MNNIEEIAYNALVEKFGKSWDAIDSSIIIEKLEGCKHLFALASKKFLNNPSAHNYNILQTAMMAFQYWNQKQSNQFTLAADF